MPRRADAAGIAAGSHPSAERDSDPESGIDATRSRLAKIDFLAPEQAAAAAALAGDLPADLSQGCLAALDPSPEAAAAALAALARESRSVRPRARRSIEAMIRADVACDADVHDHFFNIRRAQTMRPVIFVESIFEALVIFRRDVAEAPVTVDADVLASLETGLVSILCSAFRVPRRRTRHHAPTRAAAPPADYPVRRWIRGHQIFAALTQGLIVALTRFGSASSDGPELHEAIDEIVLGLSACAAALAFTADFPAGVYDAEIRPAMCPPHLPRGFSGLLSADHRHLVKVMKELKPRMEWLRLHHGDGHRAIVAALSEVYDRHKLVCARFVGADRPSLLMMSDAKGSGTQQLERFKSMRIRDLG